MNCAAIRAGVMALVVCAGAWALRLMLLTAVFGLGAGSHLFAQAGSGVERIDAIGVEWLTPESSPDGIRVGVETLKLDRFKYLRGCVVVGKERAVRGPLRWQVHDGFGIPPQPQPVLGSISRDRLKAYVLVGHLKAQHRAYELWIFDLKANRYLGNIGWDEPEQKIYRMTPILGTQCQLEESLNIFWGDGGFRGRPSVAAPLRLRVLNELGAAVWEEHFRIDVLPNPLPPGERDSVYIESGESGVVQTGDRSFAILCDKGLGNREFTLSLSGKDWIVSPRPNTD